MFILYFKRLLKRLKAKGDEQVQLEKKEQGFSLYINGANKDLASLPTSRRTKTADGECGLEFLDFLLHAISFKIGAENGKREIA